MAKRLSTKAKKRRKDQATAYTALVKAGASAKRHKVSETQAKRALFRKNNPCT